MAQLWGGRFTKKTDQMVYDFNASISFDKRLYRQDIEGSMAHVRMLAKQQILTDQERDQILEGLTVDYVHVLDDRKIVRTGDGRLVGEIIEEGFRALKEEAGK